MCFDIYKYVYSESVFNTLYIEIKQILKKFPSLYKKRYKALQKTLHFRFRFAFIKVYIIDQQNAWTFSF